MPIFDYTCCECGYAFERLVRSNTVQVNCPECSSPEIEKMISAPAVSSDATKERARQSGLARNKKLGVEKSHAEHEYYHKHVND